MELLRLEQPLKMMESNCLPSTTMFTSRPCSQLPHLHVFEQFLGWWFYYSPFYEEIFPCISSKLLLPQPEAVSPCSVTCYLEKRPTPSSLDPPVREL